MKRRDFIKLLGIAAAGPPPAAWAQRPDPESDQDVNTQNAALREQLIGIWELVWIISHYVPGNTAQAEGEALREVPQPYGGNAKGRLTFERNGRFASTILDSSGSKPSSDPEGAPVEFVASTGTFSMYPRPRDVEIIFDSGSRRSRVFIEIESMTAKELQFSTFGPPGNPWSSSFVYRRVQ